MDEKPSQRVAEFSFMSAGRGKIIVFSGVTLGVSATPGQATCSAVVNQHIMNFIVFCVCFDSVTVCYFYLFGCYFVFLVGGIDAVFVFFIVF